MAKKLMINCGTCDARNVKEETLAAYENIVINCGDVIVTPESKVLLNSYGVVMNCGNVLELEKDVKLQSVNGKAQIRSTDVMDGKVFLEVNGKLEIGPNTQALLKQYVGIMVNGKVMCPESLSGSLGMLCVNGATVMYPDDAILLKRDAVIDRTFVLRAKKKRYWSEKRMFFVDPKLDAQALTAKGAAFQAQEVILAESLVERLIDCIDERAEVIIVPDGTAVVLDDLTLDEAAVKKYGKKLYIQGDVSLEKDAAPWLEQMEYLNIRGDAKIPGVLKGLLWEKAAEVAGTIQVKKGCYLSDRITLRISRAMLEQEPEGIQAEDCVTVKLDKDIPEPLIRERLVLRDCVTVRCTPEQENAVSLITKDVMSIQTGEGEEESDSLGIGKFIKSALGAGKEMLDTKVINAGDYIL